MSYKKNRFWLETLKSNKMLCLAEEDQKEGDKASSPTVVITFHKSEGDTDKVSLTSNENSPEDVGISFSAKPSRDTDNNQSPSSGRVHCVCMLYILLIPQTAITQSLPVQWTAVIHCPVIN
jgi:hypothetical protein